MHSDTEYVVDFLLKANIVAAVTDDVAALAIKRCKAQQPPETANGNIFVMSIKEVFRARSGETGADAL